MKDSIAPLFTWRSAICDSDLKSSTKCVLFALSFYMNERGSSCFPSQSTLAKDTSLSERAVRNSLKEAAEEGWIIRKSAGKAGRLWQHHEYYSSYPQRPEPCAGLRPEPCAGKTGTVFQRDRNRVPPITSLITPKNTPLENTKEFSVDNYKKPPLWHRLTPNKILKWAKIMDVPTIGKTNDRLFADLDQAFYRIKHL